MSESSTLHLFDEAVLDTGLVHRLLYSEFNRFPEDFERKARGDAQGFRSLCILWWAAFAPELVPPALVDEMLGFVGRLVKSDDRRTFGWSETIPITAALACIFRDGNFVYDAVRNLATGASWLRDQIAVEIAVAMPWVPSDMPELLEAVRYNFQEWHFGSGDALALYAASRGTKVDKTKQIAEWCSAVEPEAPDYDMLVRLRDRGSAPNPLAGPMLRIQRYVILRLAAATRERPVQLTGLFRDAAQGLERIVWGGDVWKRVDEHPLTGAWVSVKDVDTVHV
jgi:hypothetical protein